MNENHFEKNLDDIMNDYAEQRDEWETILSIQDGQVKQFKHSNGKQYFCALCTDDITIKDEQKLVELLQNKTVEQQMEHFYITESAKLSRLSYEEVTKGQLTERATKLSDYNIIKLIMKNGIIVGVIVNGYWGIEPLYVGESVCTYYASDNNGSGSNDREDNIYLIVSEIITR